MSNTATKNKGKNPYGNKRPFKNPGTNINPLIIKISALVLLLATVVLIIFACAGSKVKYVEMTVENYGTIILKIDMKAAPITAKNFIKLVKRDFYDGLSFHRVIDDFMIQGGDPKGNGTGSSNKTIKGEFLTNGYDNPIRIERGVIAMARGNDPDSASCQFFICNASSYNTLALNGYYASFGYVVEGMDVVDKITEKTAPYGDGNGMIYDESKRAVITEIKIINYKESK